MRMREIAGLALEGIRRTPLRTALTALGVTIATGALLSMVGFALGVQEQAERPFEELGLLNNIEVRRADDRDRDRDDEEVEADAEDVADAESSEEPAPRLDDEAIARFEAIGGVKAAYPDLVAGRLEVHHGDKDETVRAVALPRDVGMLGVFAEGLLAHGRLFSAGTEPEILIGSRLARELGFEETGDAVGASIRIEGAGLSPEDEASFRFERREIEVTVCGVYEVPPFTPGLPSSGLVLPVDVMKEIPGVQFRAALAGLRGGSGIDAGYGRVVVRVEQVRDVARIAEEIEELGYEARTVVSEMREMRTFFIVIDVLLASVGTVALIVAGLGIVNTFLMSVLERHREIGIYKSLGATDGDVRMLFLTEAAIVGVLGGIGGILLGRVVSFLLRVFVNQYARSQGVEIPIAVFSFPAWLLLTSVLFAAAVSLVAGVVPASRAARVDPILVLRGE